MFFLDALNYSESITIDRYELRFYALEVLYKKKKKAFTHIFTRNDVDRIHCC